MIEDGARAPVESTGMFDSDDTVGGLNLKVDPRFHS